VAAAVKYMIEVIKMMEVCVARRSTHMLGAAVFGIMHIVTNAVHALLYKVGRGPTRNNDGAVRRAC
jgi:hypothetical protein